MRKILRYTIIITIVLTTGIWVSTGFFAAAEKPPVSIKLSKAGLLKDLEFLDRAIRDAHPVNYENQWVTIRPLIDSIRETGLDSLSKGEYRFMIGKALVVLGCVHTNVESNPLVEVQHSAFPLKVTYLNGKLYYIGSSSKNLPSGIEIIKVNNISTALLFNHIKYYAGSDGPSDSFSMQYMSFMPGALISLYMDYPRQYQLFLANGDVLTLPALNNTQEGETAKMNQNLILSYLDSSATVLKISNFNSTQNYKTIFEKIDEHRTKNLILDLRGNTGGDRDAAVELTRYLVGSEFSYQIVQPKRLHAYSYLNSKGKTYYLLSLLKYNFGNFFISKRSALGRTYTYTYQPSSHIFKGKVYVLTDGFTASSATMVTSWLKQYTSAVFVGRQSGGGYNGNSGGSFPLITLPYSKIVIRFPIYRLVLDASSKQREGIVPDFPVHYELKDILSSRDKDIDTVKLLISQK